MRSDNLRHSARAIVFDEQKRVLLCRHTMQEPAGAGVWAAPGGQIEADETPIAALKRELREEVGLVLDNDPPHVWRQEVVDSKPAPGYDGVRNDYFLVHAPSFDPHGALSAEQLAAENIGDVRWWLLRDVAAYHGSDLFSPRDLAARLTALAAAGAPESPVLFGV